MEGSIMKINIDQVRFNVEVNINNQLRFIQTAFKTIDNMQSTKYENEGEVYALHNSILNYAITLERTLDMVYMDSLSDELLTTIKKVRTMVAHLKKEKGYVV